MNELREAYRAAVKAHNENPTDATNAEVIRTAKAAATWIPEDAEPEYIYAAELPESYFE